MPTIYADYASAVPCDQDVMDLYMQTCRDAWANPSSHHRAGRQAKRLLDQARHDMAQCLSCEDGELYFTSGGSEGLNWALRSVCKTHPHGHIVCSAIEHPAVLRTVQAMQKEGVAVTYVNPNSDGLLTADSFLHATRPNTVLWCAMAANNETGVVQPIPLLGQAACERGILLLSDGVQLPDSTPVDLHMCGAHMMAFSSHKFGGVRGHGMLYVKRGTPLRPYIYGGSQENGMRAGTESPAAAVASALALQKAKERHGQSEQLRAWRDAWEEALLRTVPALTVNGKNAPRLAGFSHLSFDGISGMAMADFLDLKGVTASARSACESRSASPSHVLLSMGKDEKTAKQSIRFSFSCRNSKADFDFLAAQLPVWVQKLRELRGMA